MIGRSLALQPPVLGPRASPGPTLALGHPLYDRAYPSPRTPPFDRPYPMIGLYRAYPSWDLPVIGLGPLGPPL